MRNPAVVVLLPPLLFSYFFMDARNYHDKHVKLYRSLEKEENPSLKSHLFLETTSLFVDGVGIMRVIYAQQRTAIRFFLMYESYCETRIVSEHESGWPAAHRPCDASAGLLGRVGE